MAAGKFITFEGGEGSGKSTQAQLLAEQLKARGIDTVLTREPGGSPFAESVRKLLLDPATPPHAALSDALLFHAARADHLEATIRPALAVGRWVISDRFADSTRVYQGVAQGVPPADLDALDRIVVGATQADLTVLLDLDPEVGLKRARARREAEATDPYETREIEFHQRLRQGFRELGIREPHRYILIDAGKDPQRVAHAVWSGVSYRLLAEAS